MLLNRNNFLRANKSNTGQPIHIIDKGKSSLELGEALLGRPGLVDFDDVEFDGLGQRSALADGDEISLSDITEGGADVSGEHLMAFLESVVLLDLVQVVTTDGAGSLHLEFGDDAG